MPGIICQVYKIIILLLLHDIFCLMIRMEKTILMVRLLIVMLMMLIRTCDIKVRQLNKSLI